MSKTDDVKEIPKKWLKLLDDGWKTSAQGFSTDEIKKKIVQWEQAVSSAEKDMEADTKLSALKDKAAELKEEIKETSKVYNETILESQAKIRYVVYLLESRGVSL